MPSPTSASAGDSLRLPGHSTPLSPAPTMMSRTEATMEAIERCILTHRLQPGDPLPTENTLCTDLGVSRSSVREALRHLQALEIVSVQQGRGAFVGDMSMRPLIKTILLRSSTAPDSLEALEQVVKIRQVLDIGLSADVVAAMKGTHDPQLHELVDTMVEKAQASEWFMDEDVNFHTTLMHKVNNPLAEQLVNAMWYIHMAALPSVARSTDGLVDTARAHRDLLVAAEQGNLAAYQKAVLSHYEPLTATLPSH